jgi:hypothetical protein
MRHTESQAPTAPAAGAEPPAPPALPQTDVAVLRAAVSGREPLAYVETGQAEGAAKAAARWPSLGRLRPRVAALRKA